jgi:hypothetical protein
MKKNTILIEVDIDEVDSVLASINRREPKGLVQIMPEGIEELVGVINDARREGTLEDIEVAEGDSDDEPLEPPAQ